MDKKNKIFVIFLGTLLVFLLCFIIYFMFRIKKTDAIVFVDDLTCNYLEEVYADRFIKQIDGTLLEKYLVDTSIVGKRKVEIQYKNRYGFVEQKNFVIEVKDVTPPLIIVNNPYKVFVGEVQNLLDDIFCADDYDDGIRCVISGEYDLNTVGNYHLNISAKDKSGNKSQKDFVLEVVKKSEKNNSSPVERTNFRQIYHKYKSDFTEVGLDISKWQGKVDYAKIKNEGVSFVMLKIGGQRKINGEIIIDPNFYENINKAMEQNLKVGVYFYSYAKNVSEAEKQAIWVVQKIKDYNLSLPIAFDWENWEHYSTFGIGFRTLNKVATSFIQKINHYGYDGMLYSSKYYLENIWYQDYYTKWIAYYSEYNDYKGDYMMWQICNNGKIDGIDGPVDIDILTIPS